MLILESRIHKAADQILNREIVFHQIELFAGHLSWVSRLRLQEYVDECVYRFNRRRCQSQLLQRLLYVAVNHVRAVF